MKKLSALFVCVLLCSTLLLVASIAVELYAQPGTLDASFGTNGIVTTAIGSSNDNAQSVAIQTDGKILVAGYSQNGATVDFALVRYNTDGSLDATFGTNGIVTTAIGSGDDAAYSVAIQTDGKILVAGYSYYNGFNYDFALVRYNTDGSLDAAFDTDGIVTTDLGNSNDFGYSVAIQTDGKILVTGYSYNGTIGDFALVRYNTDGSLDAAFDTDGIVTTDIGSNSDISISVAIQTDGKILVAGESYNGINKDLALVRYNTDGSLDVAFDTDGMVTTAIGSGDDGAYSVAIQTDGKIVMAGQSYNGTNEDLALVRYNTDGSLDAAFDTDGKVTTAIGSSFDYGRSVAIQTDGKILVAGSSDNGTTSYDFVLVRYNTDGSLNAAFDTDGIVITAIGSGEEYGYSVAIQTDGTILVAGESNNGVNNDFAVVRYIGGNCALSVATTQTNVSCNGGSDGTASATATNGISPYAYKWSNNNTIQTITNLTAGTYTVTATDANNCTTITSVTITEPPALTASITSTDSKCGGLCYGIATVSASGGVLPYIYSWSNGQTDSTATGLCAVYYPVTVTDANACQIIDTAAIYSPLPIAIIASVTEASCDSADGAIAASATGGFGAFTYKWSNGTTSASLSGLSAGTYSLTVTDMLECFSVKSIAVSTVVNITYTVIPDTSVNAVTFNNTTPGNIANWHWDFGDGYSSNSQSPYHKFSTSGAYYICVTAFDPVNNCSQTRCNMEFIGDTSTAAYCAAFYEYDSLSAYKRAFYDSSAGDLTGRHWDFGDNAVSNLKNPVHTFASGGFYNVCLTVFDSLSKCMDTYCNIITVVDTAASTDCYAYFTFYPDVGNTVHFTDYSVGGSKSFWNFGDGKSFSSTGVNVSHNYGSAGYFDVCLTIYDSTTQCIASYCADVYAGTDTMIVNDCSAGFNFFVSGNNVIFSDESQGIFTDWYWEFGDGDNSNKVNPSHDYADPGFYDVCLTVYNAADSCMDTHCDIVQIADTTVVVCDAFFEYFTDSATRTVVFSDASAGKPDFWYWNLGDFSIANNQQNPSYTYAQQGYYEVCLTIYKGSSCQSTYCKVIAVGDVSNSVFADFNYFTDSVTSTAYFSDQSLGNITKYNWEFGDGQFSIFKNPAHTYPLTEGWYLACLTVKNANSVEDMTCKNINIYNTIVDPCLYSCVWPGDANSSLESNHYDLMSIGLNYNKTGPVRDSLSTRWIGHHADNWASKQIHGVNNKHADCNGDGVINVSDILAIKGNFGFSHPYQPGKRKYSPINPDLYFEVLEPNEVAPGTEIEVKIMAGKDSISLYGIAFEVFMDLGQVKDKKVTMGFDTTWVGYIGSDMITFDLIDTTNNFLAAALARTTQTDKTGYGEIARMKFTVSPTFTGTELEMSINSDYGVDSQGDSTLFNNTKDTIPVNTGIKKMLIEIKDVILYPNPSDGSVTFELPVLKNKCEIIITNTVGEQVYFEKISGCEKKNLLLNNFSQGMYLIQIYTEDVIYRQKIQIIR